jgi:hypothetical protein
MAFLELPGGTSIPSTAPQAQPRSFGSLLPEIVANHLQVTSTRPFSGYMLDVIFADWFDLNAPKWYEISYSKSQYKIC